MRRFLWCAALWALPLTAQAMDSSTLLGHPARYRVLYADEMEAVYADMDTVRRHTLPTGTVCFALTMYAEAYKYRPGAADYARGTLAANVQRYDARIYGDLTARTYRVEKKLREVYDREGRVIGGPAWCGPLSLAGAAPLFVNLYRAAART